MPNMFVNHVAETSESTKTIESIMQKTATSENVDNSETLIENKIIEDVAYLAESNTDISRIMYRMAKNPLQDEEIVMLRDAILHYWMVCEGVIAKPMDFLELLSDQYGYEPPSPAIMDDLTSRLRAMLNNIRADM